MAFIRHVAVASKDPAGTAEFYKKHFDLKELYRQPKDTGEDGVWLSDGYIYFAILKHGPNTPQLGPEQSSDFCGIHHIGFMVDDQRAKVAELEAADVSHVRDKSSGSATDQPDQERAEREVHRTGLDSFRRSRKGLERGDPVQHATLRTEAGHLRPLDSSHDTRAGGCSACRPTLGRATDTPASWL